MSTDVSPIQSLSLTYTSETTNEVINTPPYLYANKRYFEHEDGVQYNCIPGKVLTFAFFVQDITGYPTFGISMWNPNNHSEYWYGTNGGNFPIIKLGWNKTQMDAADPVFLKPVIVLNNNEAVTITSYVWNDSFYLNIPEPTTLTLSTNVDHNIVINNTTYIQISSDSYDYIGRPFNIQFANNLSIKSVIIGSCIDSIDNYAFSGCSNLTSVTILNNVSSIGVGAFNECSSLNSISIPNSVTSIGNSAFKSCTSLTSITIPNSVTTIGVSVFNKCTVLTSITIPNSVTSIGSSAFYYCTSLNSITIPSSVTSFGDGVFAFCTSLNSITIPSSVTIINSNLFKACTALTAISIPNSVTSIGDYAFAFCTGLTVVDAINLINNVIIGGEIFYECTSLNTVSTYSTNLIQYIQINYSNEIAITCFKEGSMILTHAGYVKIEDLKKGDRIKTMNGEYRTLEMIGTRAVFHYGSEPRIIHQLYKYSKETHPELIEDLVITGFHARLVDEYKNDEESEKAHELLHEDDKVDNKFKLPAYVDETSIVYEEKGNHNVFHIVLENEDVTGKYGIYANGMLVESCSKFDMINYAKMIMME
jgi:hypothetical protein